MPIEYMPMASRPYVKGKSWVRIEGGEEGVPPVVTDLEIEKGIVPDVSGMGLKDALYLLENEGYKVNFSGSGRVVSQTPDAGTALGRGHKITLTLK